MFWHVSVCLSTPWGGYPGQVQTGWGGGLPGQVQAGGYPTLGTTPPLPGQTWLGGTPPRVPTPLLDLAGGTSAGGVPHLGYPRVRPGQGYPCRGRGTPPWVIPPPVGHGWGVPLPGGVLHLGWSTWYAAVGMASCVHAGGLSCYNTLFTRIH